MEMPSSVNDNLSFKTIDMVLTQFKSIGEVAKKYHISIKDESFVKTTPIYNAPEDLHKEIKTSLRLRMYKHSEIAICEQLIHPVLRSLWLDSFENEFLLWSHTTFQVTDVLTGIPDYLFSERSLLYDSEVLESPILVAVEAKKDNFQDGWAQCLAEMVAAQMLNNNPQLTVYGIVTNGVQWELGKLKDKILSKDYKVNLTLTIAELDILYTALYYILTDCKRQLSLNRNV
jgi:hypothetical protein